MIIGREQEIKQLRDLLQSPQSEFVAVYGRRRVGKTFLIREAYHLTMVTSFGLVNNAYANEIQAQVTMDDLFIS